MMVLVHSIIAVLLISGLAVLTGLVLYLWFFTLVYFATGRCETPVANEAQFRFVFVVPAHNEESGISATVQSLLRVNYPRELFDVVVIADNCTDGTVEQARNAGAQCLERHDTTLRGKGYALRHAFNELMPRGYGAFVVIDADSIVSANFLSVLDARLCRGEQVVQAYDGMSNPDATILTYLFQVGNLIENKLYWEPKDHLSLPIFLRGNGMCFASEILTQYPWDAFSVTEDTEYGLMLVNHGITIHFAPDIGVFAHQPETLQQAFDQRVRWASGNSSLTKGRALKLIASGFLNRNIAIFDVGISLIAGSRPLLLVVNIALLVVPYVLGPPGMALWAGILLSAQLIYICLGILLNGLSAQNMKRLILSPLYLAWLCLVSLLGVAGFRKTQWVRTNRS